jgi:hypothetical protein
MFRAVAGSLAMIVLVTGPVLAQVKLEYKFPEGTSSTTKAKTKTHQILTLMGQAIETNAEEQVVATRGIGKRNADGSLPITETVDAIRAEISLPGGSELRYDSANPDATKVDLPQLAYIPEIFKALVGSTYTVIVDDKHKAKSIEGADKVLEKVKDKGEQVVDAIKGRLEQDKLKAAFDQTIDSLPTILVRPGETWDRTESRDIGGGQTLTFKNRYEYLGTVEKGGKTLDKIGVRSNAVTLTVDPETKSPAQVTKSDLKVESSDSTLLFDRAVGKVVDRQGKVRITGDLTLDLMGNEVPGTLDLTLETTTTVEPNAKK